MAATYDSVSSQFTTAVSSITKTHTFVGSANPTLTMLFANNDNSLTHDTVTFNGSSATKAVDTADATVAVRVSIWYLGGTAGSHSMVFTQSGSSGMYVGGIGYIGSNDSSPAGATGSEVDTSDDNSASCPITTSYDNSKIVGVFCTNGLVGTVSDANCTMRYELDGSRTSAAGDMSTTTAGSYTPSLSLGGDTAKTVFVALEVRELVAAATATRRRTLLGVGQ